MPVYRDPDGNIIEEKSKPTDLVTKPLPKAPRDGGQAPIAGGSDKPTKPTGPPPPTPPGGDQAPREGRLEDPTKPMQQPPTAPGGGGQTPDAGHSDEEERTRINTGGRTRQKGPQPSEESAEKSDGMDDPVVGWLAIVEGPGKGRAMQLGYGSNPIGRGETARIKLNFGDDQISRGGHAVVTYDPRGRKFYVQHGGGTNLTYLNDEPVLIPIELPALSHISIGNTILRFVPLCGDAFDWQDTEENDDQ